MATTSTDRRPQLSVGISTFGTPPAGGWRDLLAVASAADEAGIDRLVVSDHVVLGEHVDRYPWGRFPTGPEADWLEPLTLIGALAAVTERVRFLTGVLVAPLRPAALLAKTVATLDAMSDGRIDLGVGVGWQPEEFTALGVPFEHRGDLLDRTIADCRTLWSGGPLEVGDGDASTPVWCAPTPVQGRLPVWFSGTLGRRNLARIVELGDGWIPIMGATGTDLADGVARLRTAFEHARRDPAELQVRASPELIRTDAGAGDVAATVAAARPLVDAGATDIHVPLRPFLPEGQLTTAPDAFAELARAFRSTFD